MQKKQFLLIVLGSTLFSFPICGYCLDYFVNGATGVDSNDCGQQPSTPCKTIRKALDNIPDGEVTIKIAKGTYVESELLIPVTGPGSVKNDITFEGGWNTNFTNSTCSPDNTVIIPGNRTAPPYTNLFELNVVGDQRQAALMLKCMKIKKISTGDLTRGVLINAEQKGQASFTSAHVVLTGFDNRTKVPNGILLVSRIDGKLFSTIKQTVFYGNTGLLDMLGQSHNNGYIHLHMLNSRFVNNGDSNQGSHCSLRLDSSSAGTIDTFLENSLIAGNVSSGDPAIWFTARDIGSNLSARLVNSTVSGNSNSNNGQVAGFFAGALDSGQITITLTNSILQGNDALNGPDDLFLDQATNGILNCSTDYSILGEYQTKGSVTYSPTHEVDADPRLNSSYHLTSGSSAINAGICGYKTGSGSFWQYHRIAPYDDIDGDPRPGYGKLTGCDIGADEYRFPWILFNPATRARRIP